MKGGLHPLRRLEASEVQNGEERRREKKGQERTEKQQSIIQWASATQQSTLFSQKTPTNQTKPHPCCV